MTLKSPSIAEYRHWYQNRGRKILGHEAPDLEMAEQLVELHGKLHQQLQELTATIGQINEHTMRFIRSPRKAG